MQITIDSSAGFCWGVVRTVDKVEEVLRKEPEGTVSVLGDIIHNPSEIKRLEQKGLNTVSHSDLEELSKESATLIIRAHGEPPSTYIKAKELGLKVVDATCPLVMSLQQRVKKYHKLGYQVVIFGKPDHAEIIGIRGVCNDECIVVHSVEEALELVNFQKPTILFSQTTMDENTFQAIQKALIEKSAELIKSKLFESDVFIFRDTICKFVSDREANLRKFSQDNDVILFVAGRNSSNGKSLFLICISENKKTYMIESPEEIDPQWFSGVEKLGITGATSTPQWYLKEVQEKVEKLIN